MQVWLWLPTRNVLNGKIFHSSFVFLVEHLFSISKPKKAVLVLYDISVINNFLKMIFQYFFDTFEGRYDKEEFAGLRGAF